ncbi:MAG: hypothetical protein Kow0062_15280 [Acidobacteriota bacterium]
MLFFRRRDRVGSCGPAPPRRRPGRSEVVAHLQRALLSLRRGGGQPRVLLTGPPTGRTIDALTALGCRVSVEADDRTPVTIEHPDATFDAVLGFDLLDQLDDRQARRLVAEWVRVLKEGGLLFVVARAPHERTDDALRFEVLPDGGLAVEVRPRRAATIRRRGNAGLERLLAGFEIEEHFLRRDGLRELLARRRGEDRALGARP